MILIIVLLILGLIIAFYRAKNAEELAFKLQQRLASLEDRLNHLESSQREPRSGTAQIASEVSAESSGLSPLATPPAPNLEPRTPSPEARTPSPEPRPPAVADASAGQAAPPTADRTPRTADRGARTADLESIIGGRWLLFAGIAAVVLGISYFVKFAFDNGWISEPLRVVAGVVAGVVLIAGGMRFWSRGLALFGHALAGAGVLVLYVSIYAALHFYGLIPPAGAFVLMAAVTGLAVFLADRQRAQPLAALGFVGGFATPMLVGGDPDTQVVLFTYMAILIAGAAAIMRRHSWPLLGAVSYVCAFILVLSWFFASYRAEQWLSTELFLTVYAVLFGYMLLTIVRSGLSSGKAQIAAAVLASAPLAYHLASMILLGRHPAGWLIYVVLFTLVWLLVDHRTRAGWLRLVVLVIVGLPMAIWLSDLQYPRWYAPGLAILFALYGLHLATSVEDATARPEAPLSIWAVAHAQINGLLLPMSLYLFLDTRATVWNPWMVASLAGWNAALSALVQARAPRLRIQFVILAGTLAAAAIVLAFDGPAVAIGWMAEGVFVGWLATRERRRSLALGSALLIALGTLQVLNLLASPLPVGQIPALNPRALAAVLAIGGLAWLARLIGADKTNESMDQATTGLIVLANLLALAFLSAEIHAFFALRAFGASAEGELRAVADASLMEQVTLSVTWALYAVVLVFVGIRRRFAPARYLAIGLFAVVVVKVLYFDIAGLDRLYRMLSVLGVGILLLVASYLYQRRAADAETDAT